MDADNRTKAIAISRMKTIRMATALLIRLRRAERMVEGQPCRGVISSLSAACNSPLPFLDRRRRAPWRAMERRPRADWKVGMEAGPTEGGPTGP